MYFNGSTENGTILAIGTAQRKSQRVDGFIVLRVPEFSDRALVNLKFPDGRLTQTVAEEESKVSYCVEGIKVAPNVPMQSWKLEYAGQMK